MHGFLSPGSILVCWMRGLDSRTLMSRIQCVTSFTRLGWSQLREILIFLMRSLSLSVSFCLCLSICLSVSLSIHLSVCLCSSQEICHNPLQFNLTTKLYKFYTRVEDSTTLSCCGTSWSDISYLKEQPDYCFSISITSSYLLAFPLSVSHPSTLILLLSISN